MRLDAYVLPDHYHVQEADAEVLDDLPAEDMAIDVDEVMPPIEITKQLLLDFKSVSSQVLAGAGVKPLIPGWLKPRGKDGLVVQPPVRKVSHASAAAGSIESREHFSRLNQRGIDQWRTASVARLVDSWRMTTDNGNAVRGCREGTSCSCGRYLAVLRQMPAGSDALAALQTVRQNVRGAGMYRQLNFSARALQRAGGGSGLSACAACGRGETEIVRGIRLPIQRFGNLACVASTICQTRSARRALELHKMLSIRHPSSMRIAESFLAADGPLVGTALCWQRLRLWCLCQRCIKHNTSARINSLRRLIRALKQL